jgi:hypothetical protein
MTVTDLRPVAERYLRNLANDMGHSLEGQEISHYLEEMGEINLAKMHDVVEEIKSGLTFPSIHGFVSRYKQLSACMVDW